jgi:hypothetical protein
MLNPFVIPLLIGYNSSLLLSIYTLIHILRDIKPYGTKLMVFLIILAVINIGIIYPTLYILSIMVFPSVILWKLSIIFNFLVLGTTVLIYSFIYKIKNIHLISVLTFSVFLGFNISFLFLFDSINLIDNSESKISFIITDISNVNYNFSTITGILVSIFYLLILGYLLYYSFIIFVNARKKGPAKLLIIMTIICALAIFMYLFYIYFKSSLFRDLHIIFYCINFFVVAMVIIKKPELFLVLTNKIYYVSIYHKSGILLFSYIFESERDFSDSAIWGNILIGINYILSEFIDKKDKIDVMKTKTSDIIVNYNTNYGFAVLVITNQKNEILENLINNFMKEFISRYHKELTEIQDLNKIINISEFKDTKNIIEKNFKLYF